jgi:hypothetical protein
MDSGAKRAWLICGMFRLSRISLPETNVVIAVWWFRCSQGVLLQTQRLQLGILVAKLRRLDRRCHRLAPGLCPSRCHQDPYPEQKFREPRERLQNRFQHDEARGIHFLLQGPDTQAAHDRTQARLLLLVGPNADPRFWQDNVIICRDMSVLMSVLYGKLGVTGALELVGLRQRQRRMTSGGSQVLVNKQTFSIPSKT